MILKIKETKSKSNMSLPKITINYDNGVLGAVPANNDGIFGLIAHAEAIADTFRLNTAYMVKSMKQVSQLGILPTISNYDLYKTLSEFYEESGEGRELWIMGMPKDSKTSDWFTVDPTTGKTPVEKLLDAANGKISGLFTKCSPGAGYTPTIIKGMDEEVILTASKAQILSENYTAKKYAPFFVLLEGYAFTGNVIDLPDLTTFDYNRVSIMLGDTIKRTGTPGSQGSAVGIAAGRLAKNQVHRNIGKVRDGALSNLYAYILDEVIDTYDIEALHDKGFITFRTHVGKSGYYFTDDHTSSEVSDDYHYLSNRRVIDKAYRITYQVLVNYLLDDIDLQSDGTINPIYAKNMEGDLESAITAQMTTYGELSTEAESGDNGVKVYVDPAQNVVATSRVHVVVRVRPKGYNRIVDVLLGFDINNK